MTDIIESRKKLHIKTWGCQMNVYDSARMADVVGVLGYDPVEEMEDADLVILNTCHIREKATEKLFSELGRLRLAQKSKEAEGERMLIAVAGCVAQAEGAEIQRRAPYVDMVFGPQTYHQLPEMIAQTARQAGKVLNTEFPVEPKFDHLPVAQQAGGITAFLSVQEGCDKFCSFCVVPYTRGAEYSRAVESVIAEAERLVANGAKELTLLGQNVNAFHGVDQTGTVWGLGRLLRRLAEIKGVLRLRYTTSHPLDMDEDLIAAHAELPQLMPFLHLPVQSGSDKILQAMNRKHKADDYRRVIEKLRKAQPEIALSSDFIVGHPGESDADFEDTLKLVEDIGFAQAYSFIYSRRPGTPAAAMVAQVAPSVADERLQRLQAVLRRQQTEFNNSFVGKEIAVLVESTSREEGKLFGRSPWVQTVKVTGPSALIGQEIKAKVYWAGPNSLKAEVCS